jgi:glycosyltransferase involved in cell wall biosynthesis
VNVLAITSSYPRYEGDPTAPFVESINRALAGRGHTIHLVLPASAEWSRPASEGSIHFHPYRYSPLRSWTPWGYSESLAGGTRIKRPLYALAPLVFGSALHAARSIIRRERIEVVHVHWVVPNGPVGAISARRHGLPLVVSLHGSDMSVSERSRTIGRATRWTFARAAAVTAPSGDLLERARRLGADVPLERIPYGADVKTIAGGSDARGQMRARLGLTESHVAVLALGRLLPMKGFDVLVEAIALANMPALRLLVVGDGSERATLEARATELGLDERTIFTGAVAPQAVPDFLAAADVVAVPSVHYRGYVDGLPNVALEGMAAGRPLVATRAGGLPELVRPGENGLLVPEKDVQALADAIAVLAADPDLRARMGSAAQRLVREEMTWEAVAEKFESIYERALRRTPTS